MFCKYNKKIIVMDAVKKIMKQILDLPKKEQTEVVSKIAAFFSNTTNSNYVASTTNIKPRNNRHKVPSEAFYKKLLANDARFMSIIKQDVKQEKRAV